jgi:hypothetical protein
LAGTSGTLVWSIRDSEKRLLLIFSNPQHGANMTQIQVAEQFVVTTRATERTVSGVVAIFSRRFVCSWAANNLTFVFTLIFAKHNQTLDQDRQILF